MAGESSKFMERIARAIDVATELLELLLSLVIVMLVGMSVAHLFRSVVEIEMHAPAKEDILHILDLILLLVLSVDILRTLAVAIRKRSLPVRIVIEAAMVAILREIIAVEVRHLDWKMILALGVAFILLSAAWAAIGVLQKRGMLAPTAVEE